MTERGRASVRRPNARQHRSDQPALGPRESRATQSDEPLSHEQRQILAGWLDVDSRTLAHVSARSLARAGMRVKLEWVAEGFEQVSSDELRQLRRDADTDPLTGIGNRRAIDERMSIEWQRRTRHGRDVAVIIVDVDGLKAINDVRGHAVGDAVIVDVARRLKDALRREDQVARVGGDEFLVVCPETDGRAARAIARKLTRLLSEDTAITGGSAVSVRVSAGWAASSPETPTIKALVGEADARLYRVKRAHRGAPQTSTYPAP